MKEKKPFISLNKLAEHLTANPVRQAAIVKLMKYGEPVTQYRDAHSAAARFLASGQDPAVLQQEINNLVGLNSVIRKDYRSRCIAALMQLESQLPLPVKGVEFHALPMNAQAYIELEGVQVSVRPDALISRMVKGTTEIGAIKLHFPKGKGNQGLGEDGRACVAVVLFEYLKSMDHTAGQPKASMCYSIDIYPRATCPCPKAHINLMKNIREACRNYYLKWHAI